MASSSTTASSLKLLQTATLQAWSQYIINDLGPAVMVSLHPFTELTPTIAEQVRTTMAALNDKPVSVDLLRRTRVHQALQEISIEGGWPPGFAWQAEALLKKWATEGDASVRAILRGEGLWALGGRLYGCVEVASESMIQGRKVEMWLVKDGDPKKALVTGSMGFPVGSWWINTAAAFRDGIIGPPLMGITRDEAEAFAILMDGDEEIDANHHTIKYRPSVGTPARLMQNSVTRNGVRVLRAHTLESSYAPSAGLRYEGLYNVTGWGVKLVKNNDVERTEEMHYTFTLKRVEDQPNILVAMVHPDIEELGNWTEYESRRNGKLMSSEEALLNRLSDNHAVYSFKEPMRRRSAVDSVVTRLDSSFDSDVSPFSS